MVGRERGRVLCFDPLCKPTHIQHDNNTINQLSEQGRCFVFAACAWKYGGCKLRERGSCQKQENGVRGRRAGSVGVQESH